MTKLTLPWTRQGRFLRALAKTDNIVSACRAASLDRRLAYRWRVRDPEFADRWKQAAARGADLAERLREAEVRVARTFAEIGVTPSDTHSEK